MFNTIFMASLYPQIKLPLFFIPPGPFYNQIYGLKITYHQLFFPQVYGTEVNYCPSLDLSVDNSKNSRQWAQFQVNGVRCLSKTRPRSESYTDCLAISTSVSFTLCLFYDVFQYSCCFFFFFFFVFLMDTTVHELMLRWLL